MDGQVGRYKNESAIEGSIMVLSEKGVWWSSWGSQVPALNA